MESRKYKRKKYTVSIDEYRNVRTVRIFANLWTITYLGGSRLLLAACSGQASNSELLKRARKKANDRMNDYKKRAQAIIDF